MSNESVHTIRIHCVVPEGKTIEELSTNLKTAFQRCLDNIKTDTQWIEETDVLKLSPVKSDVFILDPLEGPILEYLEKFKCCIIGPRCLISSIERCEPIPPSRVPLANLAMQNLVITLSGFEKAKKERLARKIEMMGGICQLHFVESVTHVVVHEALSIKYNVAVEREIPIMESKWVYAVWQANQDEDVAAVDAKFSEYTAPPFIGLYVTFSKFDAAEVENLKKLVEDNGGSHLGRLQKSLTKILVVNEPSGDKYRCALQWKIPCVNADWIRDSIQAYHALPPDRYASWKERPGKVSSSTPTKDKGEIFNIPDVSAIVENTTGVNQTFFGEQSQMTQQSATQKSKDKEIPANPSYQAIESMDIAQFKICGTFLDGCKIFCSGFSERHLEKLRRIIVNAGGIHYWKISDVVTHVVIGDEVEEQMKQIKSLDHKPHLVSSTWIEASSELRKPANEKNFLFYQEEEPVAKSKSVSMPPPHFNVESILQHYVTAGAGNDENDEESKEKVESGILPMQDGSSVSEDESKKGIFSGLKFLILIDNEDCESVTRQIEENGGLIVDSFRQADHVVTTYGIDQELPKGVNALWIEECVNEGKLIEITALHRPFVVDLDHSPLEGCVVVFSGYRLTERTYLECVALALGAYVEEKFSRRDIPDKNVRAATHLICNLPVGEKYNASNKWHVKAVTGKWILTCLFEKKRVSEDMHLTKDAVEGENIFDILDKPQTTPVTPRSHNNWGFDPSAVKTPETLDPPAGHGFQLTPKAPMSLRDQVLKADRYHSFRLAGRLKEAEKYHGHIPFSLTEKEKEDTGLPLFGKSVYVSGWMTTPLPDLYKKIEQLGGTVRFNLDRTVNYVLDEGRSVNKDVKQAKEWNIPLVSPFWIDECISTNELVDASLFPHTYNPHMSLQVSSQSFSSFKRGKMSPGLSAKSSRLEEEKSVNAENATVSQSNVPKSNIDDHLDAIAQMLASSAKKQQTSETLVAPQKPLPVILPPLPRRVVEESQEPDLEKEKGETEGIESQSTAFTWVDPQEKALQEKLAERDRISTEKSGKSRIYSDSTQDVSHASESVRGDSSVFIEDKQGQRISKYESEPLYRESVPDTPSMKRSVKRRKPIVMFSIIDQQGRDEYGEMIRELGGMVIDSPSFEPSSTHIVIPCPMRNEKLLASIAGGRWVMHPSWLSACEAAGEFVPEDDYEWGRPGSEYTAELPQKSPEYRLAIAAHRWRKYMDTTQNEQGVFRNFRVILHTPESRRGPFRRLIEAGGGTISEAEPPYTHAKDVSHVIAELDKCNYEIDLLHCAKNGIPVVIPLYLNEYLISESIPDFLPFFPEEYKKFESIFEEAYKEVH